MLIRFLTLSTILMTIPFSSGCQSTGQPKSCSCQSEDQSTAYEATPLPLKNDTLSSETALEGRLAAAIKIRVPSKQVEALTGFAVDAAKRGENRIFKESIERD